MKSILHATLEFEWNLLSPCKYVYQNIIHSDLTIVIICVKYISVYINNYIKPVTVKTSSSVRELLLNWFLFHNVCKTAILMPPQVYNCFFAGILATWM